MALLARLGGQRNCYVNRHFFGTVDVRHPAVQMLLVSVLIVCM